MPGGSKSPSSTTQTQRMEPWGPAQGALRDAIGAAQGMFQSGGFAPQQYQGSMVAGFGNTTQQGLRSIMQQAGGGTPGTDAALGYVQGAVNGQNQYNDLQGVRDNILSSAIPAAVSQFAGSGLTNSSVAQAGVGDAAAAALAPFEYDAYNQQQNRALQAAQLAPGLERAQYLPGQMQLQIGGMQDQLAQAQLNDRANRYNQNANQELNNFNGYLQAIMGLGGLGGTQTGTATQPGASFGQQVGGSLLGGLGAYGALAANPVTAPFAIAGGIGSGLLGLL